MEGHSLSSQEELILLLVGALQPNAYAYTIKKELMEQANKKDALASIHTVLYRMEDQGYLKSSMGGAEKSRGGRSKRLYQLTMKGFRSVETIKLMRNNLWSQISTRPYFTGH